jgi:hypothetical protein
MATVVSEVNFVKWIGVNHRQLQLVAVADSEHGDVKRSNVRWLCKADMLIREALCSLLTYVVLRGE